MDEYAIERQTLVSSGEAEKNAKANDVYTFNQASIDATGYGDERPYEGELSFGGPLGSQAGFFLTYRLNQAREYFPNENHKSMRYSLKLTFKPLDGVKLGGWVNREFAPRFRFFPQGYPANKKLGVMAYLRWTQTLSSRTFYEVKISQLNRSSEFGYSDDNGNGRVEIGESSGNLIVIDTPEESNLYLGVNGSSVLADGFRSFFSPDPGNEKFFDMGFAPFYRLGQPGFYYESLHRNVSQLKVDLTSQVSYNHQVKAGILYRYHKISQFKQQTQVRVIFDQNFPFESISYKLIRRNIRSTCRIVSNTLGSSLTGECGWMGLIREPKRLATSSIRLIRSHWIQVRLFVSRFGIGKWMLSGSRSLVWGFRTQYRKTLQCTIRGADFIRLLHSRSSITSMEHFRTPRCPLL